jgi:hypothetical protein
MTTRAFGAHTPRELLDRANYEVGELEKSIKAFFLSEDEGKHRIGSLAGACTGSLWNLVDWLANSTDTATRTALAAAGYADYESIRNYVKANSPALTLWWEVTNGYKHCELTGYTLTASQIDKAELSAPLSLPPGHPIAFRFVPKIKTKAGENLPALDVYKDALAFWDGFFKNVGL